MSINEKAQSLFDQLDDRNKRIIYNLTREMVRQQSAGKKVVDLDTYRGGRTTETDTERGD